MRVIRTLSEKRIGVCQVLEVEVTEDRTKDVAWDVYCLVCDEYSSQRVTRAVAVDDAIEHNVSVHRLPPPTPQAQPADEEPRRFGLLPRR